jgi:hypothetical protein
VKRRNSYEKNRKFTYKVGKNKIEFTSKQDRREYITMRRLQAWFGRGHISYSSSVGKSVCVTVQSTKLPLMKWSPPSVTHFDLGKIKMSLSTFSETLFKRNCDLITHQIELLRCPECHSVVRYDRRNEQVCSGCGLVINDDHNVVDLELVLGWKNKSKKFRSQFPIPMEHLHGESSETIDCFDKYFQEGYYGTSKSQRPKYPNFKKIIPEESKEQSELDRKEFEESRYYEHFYVADSAIA